MRRRSFIGLLLGGASSVAAAGSHTNCDDPTICVSNSRAFDGQIDEHAGETNRETVGILRPAGICKKSHPFEMTRGSKELIACSLFQCEEPGVGEEYVPWLRRYHFSVVLRSPALIKRGCFSVRSWCADDNLIRIQKNCRRKPSQRSYGTNPPGPPHLRLLLWINALPALALILCHALLAAPLHQRWD